MALVKRNVKGLPLTNEEMDNNLQGLADGNNFTPELKKTICTAWVNFDGTTTPPTIKDSFNVSDVLRVETGVFEIVFENAMDNTNYSFTGSARHDNQHRILCVAENYSTAPLKEKVTILVGASGGNTAISLPLNSTRTNLQIFGGKD